MRKRHIWFILSRDKIIQSLKCLNF